MNRMPMMSITKLAIIPGGVASLDELGEDLKVGKSAKMSSLLVRKIMLRKFIFLNFML